MQSDEFLPVKTADNLTVPWTPSIEHVGNTAELGDGIEQVTFREPMSGVTMSRFMQVLARKP